MVARGRTVEDKVADWYEAYTRVAAELSPDKMRDMWNNLMAVPLPDDPDNVITYTARMNTAMAIGRMIAANDRAAAMVASLITQTGIKPVSLDAGDDT